MDRLTIKISGEDFYRLKAMCYFDKGKAIEELDNCCMHCECHNDCGNCGVQEIQATFDHLAAYENTGLTPEEIKKLQATNVLLRMQVDIAHETILAIEKEINKKSRRYKANEQHNA